MQEGSLSAPIRHPLNWEDPTFINVDQIEQEMERVFDICHGCRLCFNLCDSFPRLFDLIDSAPSGELDTVDARDYKTVADACTLCDMCFMTKCPYVPPHDFAIDFPHLMLRYKAYEHAQGKVSNTSKELTKTDRNGEIGKFIAPLANWATAVENKLTRPILEKTFHIHREAALPKFHNQTLEKRLKKQAYPLNPKGVSRGKKVALYATCNGNYNNPQIGQAAQAVLAHNGVDVEFVYPGCCGMPQMEQGDLKKVALGAKKVTAQLVEWIDKGYDIVTLMPSCALMLKMEWPLIVPHNSNINKVAAHTKDLTEYVVFLAQETGLTEGLTSLNEGLTVHIPCHARAQNMGPKAVEMLRLIPQSDLHVISRCSGHGGSWGVMEQNFDVALKIGKPVFQQAIRKGNRLVLSECPLAAEHIIQGIQKINKTQNEQDPAQMTIEYTSAHPIEIFAKAYGLV